MSALDLLAILREGPLALGVVTALVMVWRLDRKLHALLDRHRAELAACEQAHRRELDRLTEAMRPAPLVPYPPPLEQVGGYRVAPREAPPSPPPS